MDEALRREIVRRAGGQCEYCHLPEAGHNQRFSIDHIIPRKHGGSDFSDNLALSCLRCNLHKGTNLAGVDPVTSATVLLFNPRKDQWREHFAWDGPLLAGLTGTGRASIEVMRMNSPERRDLRHALIAEGLLVAGE